MKDGVPRAAKNRGGFARLLVIPGRERERANPESRRGLENRFWMPGPVLRTVPE